MLDSIQENNNLLFYFLIAASILLVVFLYVSFTRFIKRIFKKTQIGHQEVKLIVSKIKGPILLTILSLAAMIAFSSYEGDFRFRYFFTKAFNLTLILGLAWSLISMVMVMKQILLSKYDMTIKDNLGARKIFTQYDILERIIIGIIVIVGVSVALMSFESIREIGVSIFASAGVMGIIIGLSAQKIIGAFLAGIQLAITQPMRIEDVVIVEDEWGWIEEINLTYVVVRIWDKRRLILPTTYFIENPFQNWTRVSADILGTVFIHTDYTFPVEALRTELTRLLGQTDLWDGKTNVLQVTNATPQTMELRVLVSASDSPTAWDLRVWLREKLIAFIQKEYPECLPRTRVMMDKKEETKTEAGQDE